MAEPSTEHDFVARQIADAVFMVHVTPGPSRLEPGHQQCLAPEREAREIPCQRRVALPVRYRNVQINAGDRMDLVAGGLAEIKATEKPLTVHEAPLAPYINLSGYQPGLLNYFNRSLIKYGIRCHVHRP